MSNELGFAEDSHVPLIFRIDGLVTTKVMEVVLTLSDLTMKAFGRGPNDFPPDEASSTVQEQILYELRQLNRRPSGSPGSVNGGNWKSISIVLGLFSALVLLWLAWFSNTVIDTRQDVAVIKCQLNPQCRVVVTSDKP